MSDQNPPQQPPGLRFHFLPKDDDEAALAALLQDQPSELVNDSTEQETPST